MDDEYPFINNCNRNMTLRAGLLNLTSASVFFLNWVLRLPSSSSVRVHPSMLVLSMPLYGLNCVLLLHLDQIEPHGGVGNF